MTTHHDWLLRRFPRILGMLAVMFTMLVTTAGAASAEIDFREHITLPIDEYGPAPLCGQAGAPFLHVTGTANYLSQVVQDANGTYHATSSVDMQGVTAVPAVLVGEDFVDLDTGPIWVSAGAFSATSSSSWTGDNTFTLTQVSRGVLVSQGSEPNLLRTYTFRWTINANGVTTVFVWDDNTACRG